MMAKTRGSLCGITFYARRKNRERTTVLTICDQHIVDVAWN